MYQRHAATSRLLLIHPDARVRDEISTAAQAVGLGVVPAQGWDETLLRLREPAAVPAGAIAVIVLGTSAVADQSISPAPIVNAVQCLGRVLGSAQVIIVVDDPLDMDTSCALVRCGVSGFLDRRNQRWNEGVLREQLQSAHQKFQQTQAGVDAILHSSGPAERNSMVCVSPVMTDLIQRAARAALVSDVPILIYGESGTGKQLLAELIHQLDPKRCTKRLLSVNCSAIAGTLAESTLFGHLRGAYTGATSPRKGIFRAADGGTVLLDEIGEMEPALQPKLLRVLQEGVVLPLGADDELPCDVRVIASTNRWLAALVQQGQFRLDLYQRLNVITLEIPPLRERHEDIPDLVQFFVDKYAGYYQRPIESIDPQVIDFFVNSRLEGNVRELENTVRQMLAFKSSGSCLELKDIPASVLARERRQQADSKTLLDELADAASRMIESGAMTLPQLVNEYERLVLHSTLRRTNTTSTNLARRLGLSRRTLYNKIRKYQLSDNDRPD